MLLSHPVCPLSVSFCRPPYGPTPTIPLVTITLFFPPFDGGACPTSETTPEIILEGRRSTNFDAVDDVVMTSSMASLRLRRRSAAEPRLHFPYSWTPDALAYVDNTDSGSRELFSPAPGF